MADTWEVRQSDWKTDLKSKMYVLQSRKTVTVDVPEFAVQEVRGRHQLQLSTREAKSLAEALLDALGYADEFDLAYAEVTANMVEDLTALVSRGADDDDHDVRILVENVLFDDQSRAVGMTGEVEVWSPTMPAELESQVPFMIGGES